MGKAKHDDKQKLVKANKNPFDELDSKYQKAVMLRLEGYRLKFIAVTLKNKESSVRQWFTDGGICAEAYKQKEQEQKDEVAKLFPTISQGIKEAAIDGLVTLKKKARTHLKAAQDALDRAGFGATQKVEDLTPQKTTIIIERMKKAKAKYGRKNNPPSGDGQTTPGAGVS